MKKKTIIVAVEVIVLCLLTLVYLLSRAVVHVSMVMGDFFESHIYRSSLPFLGIVVILLGFNIGLSLLLFKLPFLKKINVHLRILLFWLIFLISATFIYCWGVFVILEHAFD
jgi:hypothetical protein